MKRILLKTILIALTLFVAGMIVFLMRVTGLGGTLAIWIVGAGMFAGIGAIWRYQPKSNEIDLKKDD